MKGKLGINLVESRVAMHDVARKPDRKPEDTNEENRLITKQGTTRTKIGERRGKKESKS